MTASLTRQGPQRRTHAFITHRMGACVPSTQVIGGGGGPPAGQSRSFTQAPIFVQRLPMSLSQSGQASRQ